MAELDNATKRKLESILDMSGGQDLDVPNGSSAIAYTDNGKALVAAVLQGEQAVTYRSIDDGVTWTATAS